MIGSSNWQFDSRGNIKLCYSVDDYFVSVDELDEAYGAALSSLEGEAVKAIYALHDGEKWDYDAPVVMRLGSTDVAVRSVSCHKLAIGIERVETGGTARMLGCDVDPEGGFDNLVGDLEWLIHDCSESIAGASIEQFYWIADGSYCPLALCCRLDNGMHLRVGDRGEETYPSTGDPRDEGFMDEFDRYALPMDYPKPAASLPVFEECLSLKDREFFAASIDKPLDNGLIKPGGWYGRTFVGGFEIEANLPFVNPPDFEHKLLAIVKVPVGMARDFLIGKPAVFLPGKPSAKDAWLSHIKD